MSRDGTTALQPGTWQQSKTLSQKQTKNKAKQNAVRKEGDDASVKTVRHPNQKQQALVRMWKDGNFVLCWWECELVVNSAFSGKVWKTVMVVLQ